LGKYVSSATLSNILEDQAGRQVMLTLFFSDVRGFTSFSERHTPAEVVEQLNKLLGLQTEIIVESGGDIDKYVGDEIVAIFTGDEGPRNAARAAIRIQKAIAASREQQDPLRVGVGIHCGEVILGMVGSVQRADFTVIGDTVNIASRLCDVAPPGEIVISERLKSRLDRPAETSGPYGVTLKGKARKQRVYKLVSLGDT
jgi:class 3 adenylate cyclase